jgi:hypothetical protein
MNRDRRHTLQTLIALSGLYAIHESCGLGEDNLPDDCGQVSSLAVLSGSLLGNFDELKTLLGRSFGCSAIQQDNNPGCCMWIDLICPDLAEPGWIYLQAKGGSVLLGTDMKQLLLAVEKLAKKINVVEGTRFLKLGITTSFKVNDVA